MASTVVGLFDDRDDAHAAVQDLMAAGYGKDRISIVAADPAGDYSRHGVDAEGNLAGEGAATGLVSGTVVGGLLGLLIGAGAIFFLRRDSWRRDRSRDSSRAPRRAPPPEASWAA